MTGCRIKPALASVDAISVAIDRNYIKEPDEQEELDFTLEDLAEPPRPVASSVANPVSVPAASPATPVAVAQEDFPGSAVKKLENRYENLVRILLDKGVIDFKDLDELM